MGNIDDFFIIFQKNPQGNQGVDITASVLETSTKVPMVFFQSSNNFKYVLQVFTMATKSTNFSCQQRDFWDKSGESGAEPREMRQSDCSIV